MIWYLLTRKSAVVRCTLFAVVNVRWTTSNQKLMVLETKWIKSTEKADRILIPPLYSLRGIRAYDGYNFPPRMRASAITFYFGLTRVKGWVQCSKILQPGGGWGRSWCEHSIGVCDPQRRIGCKSRLKAKSGGRWMRWSPFLTRRRGRNIAAVSWRSTTTVRVANCSRRRLAFGIARPLLIVISFNKETEWLQDSGAV